MVERERENRQMAPMANFFLLPLESDQRTWRTTVTEEAPPDR
jgi:hypothetical protein